MSTVQCHLRTRDETENNGACCNKKLAGSVRKQRGVPYTQNEAMGGVRQIEGVS